MRVALEEKSVGFQIDSKTLREGVCSQDYIQVVMFMLEGKYGCMSSKKS